MKCTNPFISGRAAFGCGRCLPCRLARRRIWTTRIMLEALDYPNNCSFVTLTYANDPRELFPEHTRKWLDRLRKRVGPIRYYLVGEYGDESWRPHYHVALFGVGPCQFGKIRKGECQCVNCSAVRETWGYGHVTVFPLERKSAQYISGYVTKKMTHREDPRLLGRHPEFARMSLKPGIGAVALWNVASEMMRYGLETRGVPKGIGVGDKVLPMGRYLRRKLGEYAAVDEAVVASQTDQALSFLYEQMSVVYAYAKKSGSGAKAVFKEMNGPLEERIALRDNLKRRSL